MPLIVLRHGHAEERATWEGDDRFRPLDERGRAQARGLARGLARHAPARIVSSPALRCVETVEPLALALGVQVEVDERLAEGVTARRALALLRDLDGQSALVCTHGDVIEALLDRHCGTGDAWIVELAGPWVRPIALLHGNDRSPPGYAAAS